MINLDDYPEILTVADVKNILRVGRNKAYNLINTEIPHFKLGKVYCITKNELINYINSK